LSYGQAKNNQAHFFLKSQEFQSQELEPEYGEQLEEEIRLFA
jgi:hypothetical protein